MRTLWQGTDMHFRLVQPPQLDAANIDVAVPHARHVVKPGEFLGKLEILGIDLQAPALSLRSHRERNLRCRLTLPDSANLTETEQPDFTGRTLFRRIGKTGCKDWPGLHC
mgnify:CR=1 FL=1